MAIGPLAPDVLAAELRRLAAMKRFRRDDYSTLVRRVRRGRRLVTCIEAARGEGELDRPVLILRHDIDHDPFAAIAMGEWEAKRNIRATYCVLHTAWYYWADRDRSVRSTLVVDLVRRLQELGHEVALHNNAVVEALRTGRDAAEILATELRFLRQNGIQVSGTATHGDRLCRELEFRNYELFRESVRASFGGERTVTSAGRSVRLGAVSQRDFGLEYEAYDVRKDLYVTDTGGRLAVQHGVHGCDARPALPYPEVAGVLVHADWWDMETSSRWRRGRAGRIDIAPTGS